MAELQITGIPTADAPNSRVTKGSERFELLAVYATLDGSGAGGDFVPTVEIVSDSGRVVGRFPAAAAVASGDSVDVTFAPFLRNGVGLTGIFYDIANVGGYLEVAATAPSGIVLDAQAGPVQVSAEGGGGNILFSAEQSVQLGFGSSFAFVLGGTTTVLGGNSSGTVTVRLKAGQKLEVLDHLNAPIFRVNEDGALQGKTGKALTFNL